MTATVRRRLGESFAAFGDVFANPSIRRLQFSWIASIIGGTAYVVALLVYAYDRDGAYAVGVIGVIRWLAAGLFAPAAGVLADRFPRVRVMVLSDVVRAVLMGVMGAIALTDGPALGVYGLSILVSLSSSTSAPAATRGASGMNATNSADTTNTPDITRKEVPTLVAASRRPPIAGPTNQPALSIVLPVTFAAVSSRGVRASDGSNAASAGRKAVELTDTRMERP